MDHVVSHNADGAMYLVETNLILAISAHPYGREPPVQLYGGVFEARPEPVF
jgi:hypothetical protein